MPKKNEGRSKHFHPILGPPYPSEKITLLYLSELKESFAYQEYFKTLEQDLFSMWPQLRRDDEVEVKDCVQDPWAYREFHLTPKDNVSFVEFTSRFKLNSLWLVDIQKPALRIIDEVAEKIINDKKEYSLILWKRIGPSGQEVFRWLDPNTELKEGEVDLQTTTLLSALFAIRGVVSISPNYFKEVKPLPYEWYFKIDLTKPKSVLLAESERLIERFYHRRTEYEELIKRISKDDLIEAGMLGPHDLGLGEGEYQWDVDNTRFNYEKRLSQLGIWRMRKQRMPFSEISPKTGLNFVTARKQYYAAFKRYQGYRYDSEKFKKIAFAPENIEKIQETCKACQRVKECFDELIKPKPDFDFCPHILKKFNYLSQDQSTTSKEWLGANEVLLNSN